MGIMIYDICISQGFKDTKTYKAPREISRTVLKLRLHNNSSNFFQKEK